MGVLYSALLLIEYAVHPLRTSQRRFLSVFECDTIHRFSLFYPPAPTHPFPRLISICIFLNVMIAAVRTAAILTLVSTRRLAGVSVCCVYYGVVFLCTNVLLLVYVYNKFSWTENPTASCPAAAAPPLSPTPPTPSAPPPPPPP